MPHTLLTHSLSLLRSVYAELYGPQARLFEGEPRPTLTHARAGTVSMALAGKLGTKSLHGAQWFITTRDGLHHFDGVYTVIGQGETNTRTGARFVADCV